MIKIAADTKTKPQQSGIGMALRTGCGAAGAMVTGAVGGAPDVAVAVMRGWVFDILAGVGFGGSGRTLMRAVSLVRGVVGTRAGASGGRGAGTGAPDVVPIGRGKGVLAAGGRDGGVVAGGGGGGGIARGPVSPPAGGVGNGFCDTGGLGIGTLPGVGTSGTDVGGSSEVGGRDGRLIRTVSPSSGAAASPRRGGRVIRTVSFFGSLASAMVTLTGGIISLSEISRFVTRQLTLRK